MHISPRGRLRDLRRTSKKIRGRAWCCLLLPITLSRGRLSVTKERLSFVNSLYWEVLSEGVMAESEQAFRYLDQGQASNYVETRLFENSFDDLTSHITRKKALADEGRYTILYLLYEYGELSRKRLSDETGRVSNKLEQPLRRLSDADLIEKIPGPEGADQRKTYYRITTLGRQEIASDIENVIGGMVSEAYHNILEDPALNPESDAEDRRQHNEGWAILDTSSEDFRSHQRKLRTQHKQLAATQGDE